MSFEYLSHAISWLMDVMGAVKGALFMLFAFGFVDYIVPLGRLFKEFRDLVVRDGVSGNPHIVEERVSWRLSWQHFCMCGENA